MAKRQQSVLQARGSRHPQSAIVSVTMQDAIFTIGHSTHSQERFITLLDRQGVMAVCDVRSQPHSRMNPQFNREDLNKSLRACGIKYVFLGNELGARSKDPSCYEDGKVRYDRLAHTELFQSGLGRIQKGMRKYTIALVCAEKEPLDCHRTILVSRHLVALGIDVRHIHADGILEDHTDALSRLAKSLGLRENERELFRSHEEFLDEVYRLQEERIAYDSRVALPADIRTRRSAAG
jgi:Protein of unknown function, DUF488